MTGQFFRFALVGTAGFVVDLLVLQLLLHALGVGVYAARGLSYLCAATSTWIMNRHFTFTTERTDAPWREWARFLASNAAGGAVNLGVYAALVASGLPLLSAPWLALAAGSVAGLFFNYFASRKFVFTARAR
ncbi:GtrA family protein [Methyloversatilis discipulorum]|jgi:putative flippase GtrA|uniref:GtrA family protein n=1 Tax=Methyloversatilis discipulorum TaxID=1119528 RepID=UPI003F382951